MLFLLHQLSARDAALQAAIRERDEARAEVEQMKEQMRHAPDTGSLWRHKKRGTTYQAIARNAEVQTPDDRPLIEGEVVVVYRGEQDGHIWVRRASEFFDGRFERVLIDEPAPRADGEDQREDQASINQWQRETFPDATLAGMLGRISEEVQEFLREPSGEEAADVVILLYCWAMHNGIVVQDAIDRKMAINRRRKWNIQDDGTGRHVHVDGEGSK